MGFFATRGSFSTLGLPVGDDLAPLTRGLADGDGLNMSRGELAVLGDSLNLGDPRGESVRRGECPERGESFNLGEL